MARKSKNPRAELLAEVGRRLGKHFGLRRDFARKDALAGLIRTILTQNTTDLTADRAFAQLRKKLPSWQAVLEAPRRQVERLIRVCGLHEQKARTIQLFLRRLAKEKGRLSLAFLRRTGTGEAVAWLTASPGIGTKTAAVVLLFRARHALFPVDTHIRRVAGRVGLVPEGTPAARVQETLAPLAPGTARRCAQLHLDMIWLGRRVCGARAPDCPACPLLDICRYARKRRVRRAG